ncbi:calmodulin-binding protein 60 D-like [Abrus precatorius]|uniref:Calmodulin-binding protein 60 D-like n=1 Tax=Abrus precatorius TaxID=3816 RepID=A0A8B8LEL5_ABRPR|nr:calmodulin-binding protein 60 D-like [Abrus precatorius]
MVSNRRYPQKHKGSGKIPIREPNFSHGDTKQASISGLRNVINAPWMNDHASYFENFLRRVVREEVEHKIQGHVFSRKRVNQTGISGAKPLQLRFLNKLPDAIFTRSNILAEDKSPLQIVLFDVRSGHVVNDGPLSSLKIEICVLNGEFGSYGSEDWTKDEFNANILRERNGKEPLLIGERFITLKNGVGCINKIAFTDNSKWQRSRRFRLGAKVVQPTSEGENIQEGRSEPFVVKDNRGELYKKHYPPSLKDEIWRLKKIAKGGRIHKRLSEHGIRTVKDFLRLFISNETSLYEKFGSIPNKSWLAIIEHAKACVIDDYKLYGYHSAEPPIGLLFNSIFILVGVTFDWQNYYSPDTLTPIEKHLVEIVKQEAYKNVNYLKLIDETKLNCLNLEARLKARQSDTLDQGLLHTNISTTQGQPVRSPGGSPPFNSTSHCDKGTLDYQIYADQRLDIREMPQNSHVEYEFPSEMYIEGDSCYLNGSHFPFVEGGDEIDNVSSGIQFINDCPPYTTCEPETGFFFGSSVGAEFSSYSTFLNSAVDISSNGKPKAVWYKFRVALKWVMSVKRDAAARKNAKLFYYNC